MLLCIAAALVNQAATKRVADRHRAVLQAFAFLNEYSQHRCVGVWGWRYFECSRGEGWRWS